MYSEDGKEKDGIWRSCFKKLICCSCFGISDSFFSLLSRQRELKTFDNRVRDTPSH